MYHKERFHLLHANFSFSKNLKPSDENSIATQSYRKQAIHNYIILLKKKGSNKYPYVSVKEQLNLSYKLQIFVAYCLPSGSSW